MSTLETAQAYLARLNVTALTEDARTRALQAQINSAQAQAAQNVAEHRQQMETALYQQNHPPPTVESIIHDNLTRQVHDPTLHAMLNRLGNCELEAIASKNVETTLVNENAKLAKQVLALGAENAKLSTQYEEIKRRLDDLTIKVSVQQVGRPSADISMLATQVGACEARITTLGNEVANLSSIQLSSRNDSQEITEAVAERLANALRPRKPASVAAQPTIVRTYAYCGNCGLKNGGAKPWHDGKCFTEGIDRGNTSPEIKFLFCVKCGKKTGSDKKYHLNCTRNA